MTKGEAMVVIWEIANDYFENCITTAKIKRGNSTHFTGNECYF